MKRFLSLVLALVMAMSLVTISAGAEGFSDADDIQYVEAVEVLSAIDVIDGYENGNFGPQGNLTRGAAAKIICNLILGPTTAAALRADSAPYPDVPVNHTFAGYIAYCKEQGIISGYNDGYFYPANLLTGYAFQKMLLGALGYDGEIEGFIGDNWSINVAKLALAIGLNDGLEKEFNGTAYATREEACLYALNTLKATMVDYEAKITANVSGAVVTVGNSVANDVRWNIANNTDGNIKRDDFVQFAEKYFEDLELEEGFGIYGRPANIWKDNKNEIGTYISKKPTYVYTESEEEGDIYKEIGKAICDQTLARDDRYDWFAYVNGVEVPETVPEKNSKVEWIYTGEGSQVEVYIDDDEVDEREVYVVEINYYLGQVDRVREDDDGTYIVIDELSEGSDLDERTFYTDEFAEEDYVVYTVTYNDDDEEYVIGEVFKPEVVTGVVDRVDKDQDKSLVTGGVDGQTYLKMGADKYVYTEDVEELDDPEQQAHIVYDLDDLNVTAHPTLNEEYNVYLDPNGFVLAFNEAEEVIAKYLFVKDSDEELTDWEAKMVLSDATTVRGMVDADLDKVPTTGTDIVMYHGYDDTTAGGGNDNGDYDAGEENQKIDWAQKHGSEVQWLKPDGTLAGADYQKTYNTNIDGLIWQYSVGSDELYELDYITVSEDAIIGAKTQWYIKDSEIENGRAYVKEGPDEVFIVDEDTLFVDVEGGVLYTGYTEVPNVENAEIAYVLEDRIATVVFILDGDIYDEGDTWFVLASQDHSSIKYDDDLYWDFEDAYVNGDKQKEWLVAYDADEDDDTNPPKVLAAVPTIWQVQKTKDEKYITEVKAHDADKMYDVVEVGNKAFWLDMDDGDLDTEKFDVNSETVYIVAERDIDEDETAKIRAGVDMSLYDLGDYDDAVAVTAYGDWKVSRGNIQDLDDTNYFVSAAVLKQDKQTAEIVWIVKTEREVLSDEAEVQWIEADGETYTDLYNTADKALANPVEVANEWGPYPVDAGGVGDDATAAVLGGYGTDGVTMTLTTVGSGWAIRSSNVNTILLEATIKSKDGTKSDTKYIAFVAVSHESDADIVVKDTVPQGTLTKGQGTLTLGQGANATVADLYAALEIDGTVGLEGATFKVISAFGAVYAENDTTVVTEAMKVVVTRNDDTTPEIVYSITVS